MVGGGLDESETGYDPGAVDSYNPYSQRGRRGRALLASSSSTTAADGSSGRTDKDPDSGEFALDMDWEGTFKATARMAFGADLDDATASKMLGVIKIDVAFGSSDGEFALRRVKIEAAIQYVVPAEDGSWQLKAGKDHVFVRGIVIIN